MKLVTSVRTLLRKPCFFQSTASKIYQQNAFTSEKYYHMLSKRLHKIQKYEIIKMFDLYDAQLLVSDHDYINNSCLRLLSFQKQLTNNQIIKVLKICSTYRVFNEAIIIHLENQLYLRLQKPIIQRIVNHKRLEQHKKMQLMKRLQERSKDFFCILQQTKPQGNLTQIREEKEHNQSLNNTQSNQTQIIDTKLQTEMVLLEEQPLSITLDQMSQICSYLVCLSVKQTKLLKMLSEYFLIAKQQRSPQHLIEFTKVNSYICLQAEQQYIKNKHMYLARSPKLIFKYQSEYYSKFFPIFKQMADQFSAKDIKALFECASQYKIKKNVFKRAFFQIFQHKIPEIYTDQTFQSYRYIRKIVQSNPKIVKKYLEKQKRLLLNYKSVNQLPDHQQTHQKQNINQESIHYTIN